MVVGAWAGRRNSATSILTVMSVPLSALQRGRLSHSHTLSFTLRDVAFVGLSSLFLAGVATKREFTSKPTPFNILEGTCTFGVMSSLDPLPSCTRGTASLALTTTPCRTSHLAADERLSRTKLNSIFGNLFLSFFYPNRELAGVMKTVLLVVKKKKEDKLRLFPPPFLHH